MKKSILENIDRNSGMHVPEGYFDSLAEKVVSRLPDIVIPEEEPLTLWKRVQPWVYLAAMFAGIALMFNVFSWNSATPDDKTVMGLHENTATEVEEMFFYDNVTDYAIYEYIADGE